MRSDKLWRDFYVFLPQTFHLLIEITILKVSQVFETIKLKNASNMPRKLQGKEVIPSQY